MPVILFLTLRNCSQIIWTAWKGSLSDFLPICLGTYKETWLTRLKRGSTMTICQNTKHWLVRVFLAPINILTPSYHPTPPNWHWLLCSPKSKHSWKDTVMVLLKRSSELLWGLWTTSHMQTFIHALASRKCRWACFLAFKVITAEGIVCLYKPLPLPWPTSLLLFASSMGQSARFGEGTLLFFKSDKTCSIAMCSFLGDLLWRVLEPRCVF